MADLAVLVEQAQAGDRQAALKLWKQAVKQEDIPALVEAAVLLGYQEKVDALLVEWWGLGGKKLVPLEALAAVCGLAINKQCHNQLQKALKAANGRRRGAKLNIDEFVLGLFKARRDEPAPLYMVSHSSAAGATSLLAGVVGDELHVHLGKVETNVVYLEEGDEGFEDWMLDEWNREQIVVSTMAEHLGAAFEGWDAWDAKQRNEAFVGWLAAEERDTLGVPLLPIAYPPAESAAPLTSMESVLPEAQNERLAEALAIIEEAQEARLDVMDDYWTWREGWDRLRQALSKWPEDAMDEIELTIIDRALYDWPDRARDGSRVFWGAGSQEGENLRPLLRLSRFFHLLDEFFKKGSASAAQIKAGLLENATHLKLDLSRKTWFKMALDPARTKHLRGVEVLFGTEHSDWKDPWRPYLADFSMWEQLTDLTWSTDEHTRNEPRSSSFDKASQQLETILPLCPGLRRLRLSCIRVTSTMATQIAGLEGLLDLSLEQCLIEAGATEVWATQLPEHLDKIRFVQCTCPTLQRFGASCLETKPTRLIWQYMEYLYDGEGRYLPPGTEEALFQAPIWSSLVHIDADVAHPAFLDGLATQANPLPLRTLQLRARNITGPQLEALTQSHHFHQLETLELTMSLMWGNEQGVAEYGARILEFFSQSSCFLALERLTLFLSEFDIDQLMTYLPKSTFPKLKHLQLKVLPRIPLKVAKAIASWPGLAQLTSLSIQHQRSIHGRAQETIEASAFFHNELDLHILKIR